MALTLALPPLQASPRADEDKTHENYELIRLRGWEGAEFRL